MTTIPAIVMARHIKSMVEIVTALGLAEDIAGITHPQWATIWAARAKAQMTLNDLINVSVVDVSVEPIRLVA